MTVEGIELEEGDIVGGGDGKPDYRVSGPRSKDSYGGYPLESIFNGHRANLICESAYVLYARKLKSASDLKVGKEYMLVGENVPEEHRGKTAVLQKHTVTTTPEVEVKEWYFWGDEWDVELVSLSNFPLDITKVAAVPYTPPLEFKVGDWVRIKENPEDYDGDRFWGNGIDGFKEKTYKITGVGICVKPFALFDGVPYRWDFRWLELIEKPEPGMVVRLEEGPRNLWNLHCVGRRAVVVEPGRYWFKCRILEGSETGRTQMILGYDSFQEEWYKYMTLLNQTEEEVLKENEPEVTFEAGDVVRCVESEGSTCVKGGMYMVDEMIPDYFSHRSALCERKGVSIVGKRGFFDASRFEKVETVDEYQGVKVGDEVVLYYGGNFHAAELNVDYMREHFNGNKLRVFKVKALYRRFENSVDYYYPLLEGPDGRLVTNGDGCLRGPGISWCVPVRKIKGLKVKSPRSALEVGSKIVLWNDRTKKFWGGQLTFETIKSLRIPSCPTRIQVLFEDDSQWLGLIDWCTPIDDVIGLELEEEPSEEPTSGAYIPLYDLLFGVTGGMDIGGSRPW